MIHSLPNRNQLARLSLVGMRSMSGKVKEIEEQLRKDDAMEAPADLEGKVNLYALNQTRMEELLLDWGEPKFRAKQIWQWINVKGATDFDKMQDLPKGLRAKLAEKAVLGNLEIAVEQVSKDGTIKRAYKLKDGQMIESVLMPYDDGRRTACISSQAGCAMGCVFCATGQMGFARQLTSVEILEQVQRFHVELLSKGERLSNVVLMGMGEPLGNYNNVMEAVRRINQDLGIGARHITISTVGLVPRIRRLAEENMQIKLAVSLHAASDEERNAIMPVNLRFPLADLMETCKFYVEKTGRRISFEWALIAGQNDTPEVANKLGHLLKWNDFNPQGLNKMCHVNLIPLNPTAGFDGKPTKAAECDIFIKILSKYGVTATTRVRRGIDIDAGCGQLKSKLNKVSACAMIPFYGFDVR
ncbi:hypothetical protein GUITHDRAFT_85651 [Guillardia theta CCMP2712]|uniref:Radical SAM core domain-containing protein n=1 Tax=Guillardia theta (strain CCMP2712) TaxID=905079 RepID=L1JN17_GUITC|nr:hypothetical protein GUITHDRAFT_85651 [Guillardia theta CCMP2712]EKX49674.1 hypothetical protein GUITHDRAFT_85651 [Guillardia theta CCMP2712]|eukprot:XP_005836654.1 hypothetical protein GUITHDRAFT_85651 [Guillardia theta CCMP2712]